MRQVKGQKTSNPLMRGWPVYLIICALIIAGTTAVYWQVTEHGFVHYDDQDYVKENVFIRNGLTNDFLRWAFGTHGYAANWHPLTWISHAIDFQMYGLKDIGGHHTSAVILHVLNSLLLFLFLSWATGSVWRSGFVAALFAIHPIHVESVAWLSERKDVLSTFFWMSTMLAYLFYTKKPGVLRYLAVVVLFALGLMSKPMVVTLPFVLLLLDYWPLKRAEPKAEKKKKTAPPMWQPLVLEKLPLFAMSAVSSYITFIVQSKGGAVASLAVPIAARISNAIISYASYIWKMIWPAKLSVFYPFLRPESHDEYVSIIGKAVMLGLLLAVATLLVVRASKKKRYLLMGWLWYLGTLVPVIGLVQVGEQSMADRYTYIPLTGLFIIIAWAIPDLLNRPQPAQAKPGNNATFEPAKGTTIGLAVASGLVIIALMSLTWRQVGYWKNSHKLFQHAIDVTEDNYLAYYNLAGYLNDQGQDAAKRERFEEANKKFEEALKHTQTALDINPKYPRAHNMMGNVLSQLGRVEEATTYYKNAIEMTPNDATVLNNLGIATAKLGRYDEARGYFERSIEIRPWQKMAYRNLGTLYKLQRQLDKAEEMYRKAIEVDPLYEDARNDLEEVLRIREKLREMGLPTDGSNLRMETPAPSREETGQIDQPNPYTPPHAPFMVNPAGPPP